jgi:hypothetical protein
MASPPHQWAGCVYHIKNDARSGTFLFGNKGIMSKRISPERQTTYYIGMGLIILGGLMFASTFVTFAMHFGDSSNMETAAKSIMARAFGGMAILILGGILQRIGASGLAGSGVVLDPEQARHDLEPFARMAGGMVKDALDEAQISADVGHPEKVVLLKCPSCKTLNEENAKLCKECGEKL